MQIRLWADAINDDFVVGNIVYDIQPAHLLHITRQLIFMKVHVLRAINIYSAAQSNEPHRLQHN